MLTYLEDRAITRKVVAALSHTALRPLSMPIPKCFHKAIEVSLAATGLESVKEAVATWTAMVVGIVTDPPIEMPREALPVFQKHAKEANNLEDKIMECRVCPTFDQKNLKVHWWVRDLDIVSQALQSTMVALNAEITHGAEPRGKRERATSDSLARFLGKGSKGSGKTK